MTTREPEPESAPERHERAEALLAQVSRERGGRLKIFLGAAPGVGKTYAMLGAARDLKRQGVDVVVGWVETHGRRETAALLEGLEILPPRQVEYRGHGVREFDLDAALARRPALILVDELAHRNAPGSRHERRYQDIEELLDAGIDVYTTVNIQHLESLNDVVARIAGVPVRETVPDALFDRARDLVLIDLPPRELIERLQQGKVYLPETAQAALRQFFSPSNLTALRELAVQAVADRVDADLRDQFTQQGARGPVGVRRRVLLAIDGSANSEYLVRVSRRIAERRQAPWSVVWVDRGAPRGETTRRTLNAAFELARRLGADTAVLRGTQIVDELLDYAMREGVSTIVLGRTRERPLARMFNRTITQQLLQRGAHFELTIVHSPAARAQSRRESKTAPDVTRERLRGGLFATGVAIGAVALAFAAESWLGLTDLSLVFLTAVLLVATRSRMSVAVYAAVLCFVGYNFFFIEPRYTFYINARQGVVTVAAFLITALLCGRMAARLREQVVMLRAANAHAGAMRALGQTLASAADEAQVFRAGAAGLARAMQAECVLLTTPREGGVARVVATQPESARLDDGDRAAADWAIAHAQAAGRFTDTLAGSSWWFLPLIIERRALGVAGLRLGEGLERLTPEQEHLAQALVQDIAQAAERVRLLNDLEAARVQGETERLRAALLSSVSHDLRSPLSAIIGAATSLHAYGEQLSGDDRRQLLRSVLEEGQRLDRYIQNLLDMTRLGHGGLKLDRDWIQLEDVLGAAVTRLRRLAPGASVDVSLPEDLPLLYVHPALIEQSLFNILENAAKFSPPGSPVRVRAHREGERLVIEISDEGPGIPDDERARIFDMFYTVARGDRGGQGTGLGLTICQGMIGAHGGEVSAHAGPDGRGTLIRVSLPLTEPPTGSREAD